MPRKNAHLWNVSKEGRRYIREHMRQRRARQRAHPSKLPREILDAVEKFIVAIVSEDQLRSPSFLVESPGRPQRREIWNEGKDPDEIQARSKKKAAQPPTAP